MAELINNVLVLAILSLIKFDDTHDWRSHTQLWPHQRYSVACVQPEKYSESEPACMNWTPRDGTDTWKGRGLIGGPSLSIFTKSRVNFLVSLNQAHIPLILPAFWSQALGRKKKKTVKEHATSGSSKIYRVNRASPNGSAIVSFCEAKGSRKRHRKEDKRESW